MKFSHIILLVVALFPLLPSAFAQSFLNLNFEQATVTTAPPGYTPSDAFNPISSDDALPYWTVSEDGVVCNAIWGSPVALDETSVALVSGSYSPINGSYSVQLSAYADAPAGFYRSSSISQTGLVPVGTQSIQFYIRSPSQAGSVLPNPIIILNGTPISIFQISQSGSIITMGGDISAFAGTTAVLTVLCQATTGGTFPSNENIFNLDDIQFSPTSVPEPSEFALGALGALLLGFRRWQNSSR